MLGAEQRRRRGLNLSASLKALLLTAPLAFGIYTAQAQALARTITKPVTRAPSSGWQPPATKQKPCARLGSPGQHAAGYREEYRRRKELHDIESVPRQDRPKRIIARCE